MTCPTHVHKMPATNMQAQRPQGQTFNKALNNAAGGAQFAPQQRLAPQAARFGNVMAPQTQAPQNPIAQIARELSNVAGQLEGLMNAGFVGIQGGMGSMFSLKGLSQGLRQVSNMLFQMSGSVGGGGQFAQVINLGGGGAMQPAYGQFGGQNNGLQLMISLPMNGGAFANGGNFGGMNFNGAGTAQYGFGNTQPALFLRAPANQNGFAAQPFQGGYRPTFAAPQGGQHNHGANNAHAAHNHAGHNHVGQNGHAGHNHAGGNAHAGHNHGANNAHAGHNHNAQAGNNAHAGHNHGANNAHAGHNHAQQGGVGAGHDFYEHARHLFPNALAPTQRQYGGFHVTGEKQITGRSTITGLQPVIEQAVAQVKAANPNLTGADLEAKIANKLTNLNDWENLTPQTQEALVRATGQDFGKMTKDEREKSINHLLHSPLPFGDINQPLTKDWSIDLGYTHTLDKTKTTAEDLGNGFFRIKLISNNNNGSHTGHSLGSFVVKLDAGTTEAEAKKIGNGMVTNTNNNDKLYLDEAARNYLHNH